MNVIKAVWKAYPLAALLRNKHGMIPLSHAASVGSTTDVFSFILEKSYMLSPEAVKILMDPSLTNIPLEVMRDNVFARLDDPLIYTNQYGWTVLHILLLKGAPIEQIKMFVRAAPSTVRIVSENGELPIHFACLYGADDKLIRHLIDIFPESMSVQDNVGNTILHLACWSGSSVSIVNFLYRRATIPSNSLISPNRNGDTPLHLGCSRAFPLLGVIRLLIKCDKNKSSLSSRNNRGLTPLDYALEYHRLNSDLIELLSEGT